MDISELVKEYGQRGIDEIKNDLNIRNVKSFNCAFTDHEDKNPSMGLLKDSFTFYCAGCQRQYDILNHYQEFYNMSEYDAIKELKEKLGYDVEVTEEEINERIESEEAKDNDIKKLKDLFEFRKISIKTLLENNIENRSKNGKDIIGVTYKQNDEKVTYQWVNVDTLKHKIYGKKDRLFNYDNIKYKDDIIFCFDIIDYLTLYEKGYRNICSKSNSGVGFLTDYYDELKNHKSITLVFGKDVSKRTFKDLITKLGKENVKYCRLDEYYTVNHAAVAEVDIKEKIKQAKYLEIKSLKLLEDIEFNEDKQEQMRFGQKAQALSGLDWLLDGVRIGRLTLLFGRDNEGKTAMTQQIMANLIEQRHSVFLYDGESDRLTLKRKLYLKMIGEDEKAVENKKANVRPIKYPIDSVREALERWHQNKLIVRSVDSNNDIFDDMRSAYRRYNTKVFFIDNLMSLIRIGNRQRNIVQSEMVEDLKRFAKSLRVHIFLVAHSHQTEENTWLHKLNVSGSKEITDKADNIISFMRDFKERHETFGDEKLDEDITNIMEVLKNREFGEFGRFYFKFNKKTNAFDEIVFRNGKKEFKQNTYSWKDYLSDDIDRNTYKKIKPKEDLMSSSPF